MSYNPQDGDWFPMSAQEAGTGRNMGGPVTQAACRLYCLSAARGWPRLRLAVFPGEAEVTAWYKAADDPDLGWDLVPVPAKLAEEARAVLAEAARRDA